MSSWAQRRDLWFPGGGEWKVGKMGQKVKIPSQK